MAKRLKLHEVSLEDDIKFRGPISFQGFQVLGWLCIVASVAHVMVNLAQSIDPSTAEMTKGILPIIETFASLSLPFLLIAACCMGGTYVATQSITYLPLLLAVRIIVSASLYFLVLRLLHAEILNECLEFAKNKIKKNK